MNYDCHLSMRDKKQAIVPCQDGTDYTGHPSPKVIPKKCSVTTTFTPLSPQVRLQRP